MGCFDCFKKLFRKEEKLKISRSRESRPYTVDLSTLDRYCKYDEPFRVQPNFKQVKNSIRDKINTK